MRSNLVCRSSFERERNAIVMEKKWIRERGRKQRLNMNIALRSYAAVHRLHCAIRWWIRHIQIPLSSISCGLKTNRKTEQNERASEKRNGHTLIRNGVTVSRHLTRSQMMSLLMIISWVARNQNGVFNRSRKVFDNKWKLWLKIRHAHGVLHKMRPNQSTL